MRGIGLIFTNDPEALLAAVHSAEADGHAEGCGAFVGRRFDDFRARAPRSPVTDFPQSSGGGFPVAFVCCGAVRRLETAESGLNGGKPRFGHKIAGGDIGRSGNSVLSFSSSLTKARLIVGYRCCTGPCLDLRASFRLGEVRVELSCSEKPSHQVGVRSKIRFVAAT